MEIFLTYFLLIIIIEFLMLGLILQIHSLYYKRKNLIKHKVTGYLKVE